ncbi:uncharacterized protein [Oscarella lobularis]|uniref:uncharacterized protein isoform X1 n=1 Tax=Oscarella lobularis TaxID=121494 RepID=UPI003313AF34
MAHPTLPLRRSRTLAALKTVQSDEMTKPQSKNQAEVDLLDDIRNFTKQRSSIEKDYAQSMLRLVGQFMQKRDANGYHGDVDSNRSAFAVWRTLLEESEKVYRARLVIAEQLMSQVSEMAKSQKQTKVQLFKKCHDLGNQLHGEMQQSIKEVTKTYPATTTSGVVYPGSPTTNIQPNKARRTSCGFSVPEVAASDPMLGSSPQCIFTDSQSQTMIDATTTSVDSSTLRSAAPPSSTSYSVLKGLNGTVFAYGQTASGAALIDAARRRVVDAKHGNETVRHAICAGNETLNAVDVETDSARRFGDLGAHFQRVVDALEETPQFLINFLYVFQVHVFTS